MGEVVWLPKDSLAHFQVRVDAFANGHAESTKHQGDDSAKVSNSEVRTVVGSARISTPSRASTTNNVEMLTGQRLGVVVVDESDLLHDILQYIKRREASNATSICARFR